MANHPCCKTFLSHDFPSEGAKTVAVHLCLHSCLVSQTLACFSCLLQIGSRFTAHTCLLAMALDSEATFRARCQEMHMADGVYDALHAASIATFAQLAFCTSHSSSGIDDAALMSHLQDPRGALDRSGQPLTHVRCIVCTSSAHGIPTPSPGV